MKGIAFAIAVLAAAAFLVLTGRELPPVVASHFDGSGAANGFMTRDAYLSLVVSLAIGIPVALALLPRLLQRLAPGLINLPHRDYWLAPERREASLAALGRRLAVFAGLLVVFFCFVHWLVVEANRVQPPRLSSSGAFLPVLAAFFVAAGLWLWALYRRFPRPPVDSAA